MLNLRPIVYWSRHPYTVFVLLLKEGYEIVKEVRPIIMSSEPFDMENLMPLTSSIIDFGIMLVVVAILYALLRTLNSYRTEIEKHKKNVDELRTDLSNHIDDYDRYRSYMWHIHMAQSEIAYLKGLRRDDPKLAEILRLALKDEYITAHARLTSFAGLSTSDAYKVLEAIYGVELKHFNSNDNP